MDETAGESQFWSVVAGTNVHTIAPVTALPAITNTLGIDGYTQKHLGAVFRTTGGNGIATYDATFTVARPSTWMVNATATDSAQNTSELSPAFVADGNGGAAPAPNILKADGTKYNLSVLPR